MLIYHPDITYLEPEITNLKNGLVDPKGEKEEEEQIQGPNDADPERKPKKKRGRFGKKK